MKVLKSLLLVCFSGVSSIDPIIQDLLTPVQQLGERCGYDSCSPGRDGWTNVHIVPHSHAELGYMKTFLQYYTGHDELYPPTVINMKRIFDASVSELWADKSRKFTVSDSEMPYFFYWWARRDGTVRRMVYELIRQGRLVFVGGAWGMNDEASTSYQSIIDSYTYSLRKINATFLSCGRPRVAWQADTFGHSREYASLVAQMGFDALFINPISFDDEMIRMERKALEFIWRGSDDLGSETDIYTHKLFDGYWSPPGFCFGSMCTDPLLLSSDSLFKNIDERVDVFINSIRYRQSPHYNTKHVMVMMGQRMGYFDAKMWFQNIDKLIDGVNTRTYPKGEKIHAMYSNPSCYLKAVYEEDPTLETKQDDFFPFAYNKESYAAGMFTSRPTFKYFVKEANIFLQMAKQLQVLVNLENNDKLFEEFNSIMGIVQDHNIISGAMRPSVTSYYIEKVHFAVQWATELFQQAFNKIRGSPPMTQYFLCYFNISSCPNTKLDMFYVTVYNPLAWPVTMPIRLPILKKIYHVFDPKGETVKAVTIKIPDHIFKIPNRRIPAEEELVFIAKNLPALGFRSYFIKRRRNVRKKKSLIKKINKNQQKKYFIREISKENKSYFDETQEYYDFDETKPDIKIDFGNVEKFEKENDYNTVVTPKTKLEKDSSTNIDDESRFTTEENIAVTVTYTEDSTKTSTVLSSTVRGPNEFTSTQEMQDVTTETSAKYLNNINKVIDDTSGIEIKNSYAQKSKDNFIRNKYVQINLDEYRKISNLNLSNGINTSLDIQYYYYVSDEPHKYNSTKRNPGAYIFRPMVIKPEPIIDVIDTEIYKSDIVQEIHCKYSKYASFAVKLYVDNPVVEIDWVVGPVPINDGFGKEVFLRYTTDLENDGVFYTDANGRQTMKRIRNMRAMYVPYNFDPIAGNFYPVTSKIHIEDSKRNLRFSIFNDRSQGGTSLLEGSIDLMLHRRILTDDSSVQTYLNETENNEGIIVRGTHYLYLTKAIFKQNKVFEKKLAKEIELKPQIMVNRIKQTIDMKTWQTFSNEFTALRNKLPVGVHILTLQEWNAKSLLLRLENYLEKNDVVKSGIKTVFVKDLFLNIKPYSIVETTLSGNILLKDHLALQWRKNISFVKNFNDFYGSTGKVEYSDDKVKVFEDVNLDEGISLVPQQIRTFVVEYTHIMA